MGHGFNVLSPLQNVVVSIFAFVYFCICVYFVSPGVNIIVIREGGARQNCPLLPSKHCNLMNAASGHINTFRGQLSYGFKMNSPLAKASKSPFFTLEVGLSV